MRHVLKFTLGLLASSFAFGCSSAEDSPEFGETEDSILGGSATPANKMLSSVLLLDANGKTLCGGLLIAPGWVATAAHCVEFGANSEVVTPARIFIGSKDMQDTTNVEKLRAADAFIHPEYDADKRHHDIALLKLEQPSAFKPARLVNGADFQQVTVGRDVIAVGWGATDRNVTTFPDLQQMVGLKIFDQTTCDQLVRQVAQNGETVIPQQICATGATQGQRSCRGDSGSPLYININGELRVAGITSYGHIPCEGPTPGVYSRVSSYIDWINETIDDDSDLWLFSATTRGSHTLPPGVPPIRPSIYQTLVGDFNADGLSDVFYYQPGVGKDELYFTGISTPQAFTVNADYEPLVGDFDGNGFSDIYWYAPAGTDKLWWFGRDATGAIVATNGSVKQQGGNYARPFVSRLDADGRADIYWYSPTTTADQIWYSRARSANTLDFDVVDKNGPNNCIPISGNFNADTVGDVFWYGPGALADTLWKGTLTRGVFDSVADTVTGTDYEPLSGDFDGNGRTDIYWYRRGSGWDGLWWYSGNGVHSANFTKHVKHNNTPPPGEQPVSIFSRATPVVGKFGDPAGAAKTDDILWHRGARGRGETP